MIKVCPVCEHEFEKKRKDAKYCSAHCRWLAFAKRRLEAKNAGA